MKRIKIDLGALDSGDTIMMTVGGVRYVIGVGGVGVWIHWQPGRVAGDQAQVVIRKDGQVHVWAEDGDAAGAYGPQTILVLDGGKPIA